MGITICKVSDITFLPLSAQHVDEKDQPSGILTSSGDILHTNFSGRVLVRLCWVYGKTRPPPLQKNHKVVPPQAFPLLIGCAQHAAWNTYRHKIHHQAG